MLLVVWEEKVLMSLQSIYKKNIELLLKYML